MKSFQLLFAALAIVSGVDWETIVVGKHNLIAGVPPTISVGDVRVVEGDSGIRSADITVSLSLPAPSPITVTYDTRDGTAVAVADYPAANGTLTFATGERTTHIRINVNGDSITEADETFDVVLSNASGATLANNTGTATIINDDYPVGRGRAVYEVRLTFVGSCPGGKTGTVGMTGLIIGAETERPPDDTNYAGILQLDTNLDVCAVTHPPKEDEAKECAMRVIASVPLNIELKVSPERFREGGGYFTAAKRAPGRMVLSISGDCEADSIDEEIALFPHNSGANVFNGVDIKLPPAPLRVGRYPILGIDNALFEVLRVVRRP